MPLIFQAVTAVLTIDKNRVKAGVFKQRAHNFFVMMVNVTSKHVGGTLKRYVMNDYCAFRWCNWLGI